MSIDNCVSSNYLRRACTDSSSVAGGGNVNKSNLCSTLNDVACDVTFSSLTVAGDTSLNNGTFTGDIKINNLTVTGTQYIEHRKDLYIGDPLITLNSGVAGANTYDIGWIGERGSSINVGTIWDESDDEFALVTTTDDGSSDSVTISSYEKLKLGSIESTGRVGIATDTPIGDLSISGSTYSERLFYTGQDGSWLQVGTGEQITLEALSVTTASAGTASLSYNDSNGVFSYTPPATGTMASKTASDYVLKTATGSLASQTANITDYVLKTATGSLASQTANITDYVLKTATGSAASLDTTNVAFTGSIFGKALNTAQIFSDNYILQYNSGAAKWDLSALPGGGGIGGSSNQVQYNSGGSFQGSPNLTFDGTTLTVSSSPVVRSADTGCAASKSCDYFVQDTETGSMASKAATDYVLGTATGSMASQTATNYVLGSATGSLASQTANITDYVLKTATGSLASQTADISDYVLGSSTGCAASKTCEYFTGSLFGDVLKAGETFSDGYTPVWEAATSKWLLQANSAGGTPPGGSDTEIQFNNGGAFGGSSYFTVDSTTGFLRARKAEVGAWPAATDYAFFGHTDLDHSALGNYALLQASDGSTMLNSSAGQYIAFRENNTNSAFISGGAMRIGNGLPSGTAGSLVVDNDVIAFYTSDERLKDNVTPIASGVNKISHLTGVRFDWNKDSYAHLQGHDIGVIAQNVESIVPEAVSTRPDGYKAVRYDKIVPVLIEGMKEQQIQIQNLQTEVDSLKYWLESV